VTHQPAPDDVIVRPSVADPDREHQRYRIIPEYDEADTAYVADYAEALARLVVWAHEDGCEIAEDVVAAGLRRAAARVGGVERLIARRSGSWEAEGVRNLAGGWEDETEPSGGIPLPPSADVPQDVRSAYERGRKEER
jgi:hypothetical protein